MEQLAPFIQHFREAFRGTKGVLKPFDGLLFRYMQLGDLQKYTKDSVVVWPTFSSCTYDESWLKAESIGNVEFEIRLLWCDCRFVVSFCRQILSSLHH